jgi:uncharacterized transporter YbjL
MELDLVALLKTHPELVLFVLLALSYLIGKLKIGRLELGAPPGMLIAGLVLGALGLTIFPGIQTIVDAIRAGEVPLPPGLTTEQVLRNTNVTYALTFLVADIAVILLCRSLPGWLRFDLRAESAAGGIMARL